MTNDDEISVREYLERLMVEHDRRYEDRFKAQELAVKDAFASTQKAIEKAESAQTAHNVLANGLQGRMDQQAKEFISRAEFEQRLLRVESDLVDLRVFKGAAGATKTAEVVAQGQGNIDRGESRADAKQYLGWVVALGMLILNYLLK